MIIVTGAGGQLGKVVVEHLLKRLSRAEIVAATRNPEDLRDLADHLVAIRHCDFADPGDLDTAFADGNKALIISVDKLGAEARHLHRNAIDACARAGVDRIFYTSHAGARADSPFAPARQHIKTEHDLAGSGVAFTALRHGFYAESCLHMIGDGLKAGELRVPEDGPVSWTARADLAAADAALLAGGVQYDGATPPLTASRAVTMAEIASIASEVTGRHIKHTVLSDDEWKASRIAAGMPEMYAEMLLGTFQAARHGDFAATDPLLKELLGREPTSMHDVLHNALVTSE